jgi:iron complex transport system substrate-binding protein
MKAFALLLGTLLVAPALAGQTLVDQSGRTVQVPDQVQRVVTIPIPLASMLMAIDGGPQRLAGMHPGSRADFDYGLLGHIYPAARKTPADMVGEGFVPNVEALANGQPDLVLQWGDRSASIVDPIAALGLPVLTLHYGDSALAASWLRLLGQAIGKAPRAEQLAQWFEGRMQQIGQQAEALPATAAPRVLYLYRAQAGLQVSGKGSSMDGDIRLAGGRNVAQEIPGFAAVSPEQLLAWDPEVILLNNFEPSLSPADIYQDARLANLSAVRNQRVYQYPHGGFRWDPPSHESPLAVDWLFSVLHPEAAQPNMRQRIRDAYQLLYAYALSDAELDQLLKVKANAGSRDYLRLFAEPTP